MPKKPTKFKVVNKKVERLELGATDTCPECGSLMKVYMNYGYEDAECTGCGLTQTQKRTRPEIT